MSVTIRDTEDTNMSMIRNILIKNLKTAFKLKDPHMYMYMHTYTQTTITIAIPNLTCKGKNLIGYFYSEQ